VTSKVADLWCGEFVVLARRDAATAEQAGRQVIEATAIAWIHPDGARVTARNERMAFAKGWTAREAVGSLAGWLIFDATSSPTRSACPRR
jgi:hypothetical protein